MVLLVTLPAAEGEGFEGGGDGRRKGVMHLCLCCVNGGIRDG